MSDVMVSEGPWFDELRHGQVFSGAPGVTLTDGLAAAHRQVVGDRLRLPLDEALAREVVGAPVAHPALVWNVAIGQSTVATQHVTANLFYRGLVLRTSPRIGDTLRTSTEVVGLRETTRRPGRPPTGLVALRVTTSTSADEPVLDFLRCAMIPLRPGAVPTGNVDDLDVLSVSGAPATDRIIAEWDLDAWRASCGAGPALTEGAEIVVDGGDVVSSAPELARMTLNVAAVHHDQRAGGGRRLVYGGHTIGIALSQVTRAVPHMLTVSGWEGCDHVGPVYEGDTLTSRFTVTRVEDAGRGASVVDLRVLTDAMSSDDGPSRPVLDWRFTGLTA